MITRIALTVILALVLAPVFAAKPVWSPKTYGPYQAEHLSTYDGDTFWMRVHIWPAQSVAIKIRLAGVDTPEIRQGPGRRIPQCEKVLAKAATHFTNSILEIAIEGEIVLEQVKADKYGDRVGAVVKVLGRDLAEEIIAAGHGRLYGGGKRGGWCDD